MLEKLFGSVFPSCGFWELKLGHQAWEQLTAPAKPSHSPLDLSHGLSHSLSGSPFILGL